MQRTPCSVNAVGLGELCPSGSAAGSMGHLSEGKPLHILQRSPSSSAFFPPSFLSHLLGFGLRGYRQSGSLMSAGVWRG